MMGTAGMYARAGAVQRERVREEMIKVEIVGRANRLWRDSLGVVDRMMLVEAVLGSGRIVFKR